MNRRRYCILKGRPREMALDDDATPHIEIKVAAKGWHRVAVNARSIQPPHELLFARIKDFRHPMLRHLMALPNGITDIATRRALALDYTRGGFIRRERMRVVPFRKKGPRNDLRELIGLELAEAITEGGVSFYAFGETWGPEPTRPDKYFGFAPGQGIHDVHMNQGSRADFRGTNRPKQDGALLLHDHRVNRWTALFFAFQSQSWRTDPKTGHPVRRR